MERASDPKGAIQFQFLTVLRYRYITDIAIDNERPLIGVIDDIFPHNGDIKGTA